MNEGYKFIIPGDPKPQQRHRDAKYGGKYDPTKQLKSIIGLVALSQHKVRRLLGPLEMNFNFYMPIPKRNTKIQEGYPHTLRPDFDNLIKLYTDALSFLYKDDAQICKGIYSKVYSSQPRTEIQIIPL